jgi:hypothetical protein
VAVAAILSCSDSAGPDDPLADLTLEAAPASGPPPLTVSFTVGIDPGADPVAFELDLEGDGTFDRSGPTPADVEAPAVYAERGAFEPVLRVTTRSGAVGEAKTVVTVTQGGIAVVGWAEFGRLESPAIAPDGRELYLATGRQPLQVVDPESLEPIAEITTDVFTHRTLISPDGTRGFALEYVRGGAAYGTAVLDLAARRQVASLPSGRQFADFTPDGTRILLLADPAVSGAALEVRRTADAELLDLVEFPSLPEWVDFGPGAAAGVVLLRGAPVPPNIALLAPATLEAGPPVPLDGVVTAVWAAARPHSEEVWVLADASTELQSAPSANPRLIVLHGSTGAALAEIHLGVEGTTEFGELAPYEWSDDGRYLYLAGDGGFFVVDALARSIAAHVPPGAVQGCDLVLHPSRALVYVVDYGGDLTALDISSFPPH